MRHPGCVLASVLLCVPTAGHAWQAHDTSSVLSLSDVVRWVEAFHPVVRQAELALDEAHRELGVARGAFDPELKSAWARKVYAGKDYYDYFDAYVQVPLWIGAFKAGYEQNRGDYLNPDRTVPPSGLYYAGLSIPLGYGLFFDQRRAALQQARLTARMAKAEQRKVLNKLYLHVVKDYWNWYFAWQQKAQVAAALELVRQRLELTREKVRLGELAAIDSLEAFINLQDRYLQLQEATAALTEARLRLSTHLWSPEGQPVELQPSVRPAAFAGSALNEFQSHFPLEALEARLVQQHPELQKLRVKYEQLEVARRLEMEKMKPKFDLKYHFLTTGPSEQPWNGTYLRNNYKLGADFGFPLFMRSARAKVQMIRLKQERNRQEVAFAERQLLNELRAAYQRLSVLGQNLDALRALVQYYESLRKGELDKFAAGESYVFLVNKREEKLLDARIKLAKVESALEKSKFEVLFLSGMPLDVPLAQ